MSEATLPPILVGVSTIVCLGDSITIGGDYPKGYVGILRRRVQEFNPAIQVINSGIGGHRSNDMLARFERDVLSHDPQLMTLSVGVNDVWHGFDDEHPDGSGPRGIALEDYISNVKDMIRQAQAAGIRVVILSSTPMYEDPNSGENLKGKAYNAALRQIAEGTGSVFVDFQPPFWERILGYREKTGSTEDFLTTDGVHLNDEGYEIMGATLLSAMGL